MLIAEWGIGRGETGRRVANVRRTPGLVMTSPFCQVFRQKNSTITPKRSIGLRLIARRISFGGCGRVQVIEDHLKSPAALGFGSRRLLGQNAHGVDDLR